MGQDNRSRRFRRVWLVLCDHSIVGVKRTKREAEDTVLLRQEQTITNILYFIDGPFVRSRDAKTTLRPPPWISKCACGVTYRSEDAWGALKLVGRMSDGESGREIVDEQATQLRSSSCRVALKKGATRRRGARR
jgi:hypothetical protein